MHCTTLLFYTHYINGHSNKVYTTTITNAIGQTILCNTLTYSNPEVLIRTNSLDFFSHLGPLHVLWQVSFGCWVTWYISSWQENYKSVFFFNFTKLQFLNNKIYSYTKNNYLALGNLVFWSISSFKTISKRLSQFFWWEINLRELRGFILQKIWALVAGRQKKKFCPWSLDLGRRKLL